MAFGNGTNWTIWSTGAAGNGGGFDPSCAGFATDGVIASGTGNAPTLTSASYTFVAGDVSAWVFFPAAGTAIAGWYIIASVAGGVATLTASVGSAQLLGTGGGAQNNWPVGASTVAGCNTQAAPTGVTWGVDYSQQAAADFTFTDMVIGVTTTQFTSVAHPVGPNYVGNIINVTAGTGFTVQRVEVTAFTAAGLLATCDKSLGTTGSTGGTGALGGATAILTTTSGLWLAGNYGAIKATATYTLAATWTIGAAVKGDATNGKIILEGYTTIRGARDGKPTITSSTNSVALITLNDNDFWEIKHFKMTHTATTRGGAFTTATSNSSPIWLKDITVGTSTSDSCLSLVTSAAFLSTLFMEGVEIGYTTSAVSAICNTALGFTLYMYGCYIHDATAAGWKTSNVASAITADSCIFAKNVIALDFATVTTAAITALIYSCTFTDNTGDCLKFGNSSANIICELQDNIAYNNTGWFVDNAQAQQTIDVQTRVNRNNFLGSNSSGNYTNFLLGYGDVPLTADPFTNRTTRDYSLNNAAGGGAAIRAAAFPVSWGSVPDTVNKRDGGAAQHTEAASTFIAPAATIVRAATQY